MKSSSSKKSGSPSGSRKQADEQRPSGQQQQAASGEGKQYGEGNYEASRKYNEGLKKHLETSDVEKEARDAAPRSASEEKEMQDAERIGRGRARGDVEKPGRDED
jgi:hypothetical protein